MKIKMSLGDKWFETSTSRMWEYSSGGAEAANKTFTYQIYCTATNHWVYIRTDYQRAGWQDIGSLSGAVEARDLFIRLGMDLPAEFKPLFDPSDEL